MRLLRAFYLFFTKKRFLMKYSFPYYYLLIAFTIITAGLTQSFNPVLETIQAPRGILSLQLAKEVDQANQVLASWNFKERIDINETACRTLDCPDYRPGSTGGLIVDFFFIIGYGLLLLYLIMQARRWFGDPRVKGKETDWGNVVAISLAVLVIVSVVADVFENIFTLQLIQIHLDNGELTSAQQPLVSSIFVFAVIKMVGLVLALGYIVISILFKISDVLWGTINVLRKYCLLSVLSILLLYFLFWGQAQGQDLLISLNEDAFQVLMTLAFVFILATISWISPRFFIVKYLLKDEWENRVQDTSFWGWFREMWQFYVTDFSRNLQKCYYRTPGHAFMHKLHTYIPRLLGVLAILVLYGAFRNVLDITNTPLLSVQGLSLESFLSPMQQVIILLAGFAYFLYRDIEYDRSVLMSIIFLLIALLFLFFFLDWFLFQEDPLGTLRGIHLLSMSTLAVAGLFFIFVTYRRSIFNYEKVKEEVNAIKNKLMQDEAVREKMVKSRSIAPVQPTNYVKNAPKDVEVMVKLLEEDLQHIKKAKPEVASAKSALNMTKARLSIVKMRVSTFVLIGLGLALLFFLFVNIWAPLYANLFGTLAVVLVALTTYISLITLLFFLYGHNRNASVLTLFVPVLLLVIAFGIKADNHYYDVETVNTEAPRERMTLLPYFENWMAQREAAISASAKYPVYIVASNGGGSRAAYWTASLLAHLHDQTEGQFTEHLLATSGASGGSVGSAVFTALAAHDVYNSPTAFEPMTPAVDVIFSEDYLSATVAALFGRDLVQNFMPWNLEDWPNRSENLGIQYEHAVAAALGTSKHYFSEEFANIWYLQNDSVNTRVPMYFGNTIQVEDGRRGVAAPVKLEESVFVNAIDVLELQSPKKTMKLSTAAMLTNRFPFVNPVGRLYLEGERTGHFADGGYFDNTGALTATELLIELLDRQQQAFAKGGTDSLLFSKLDFHVIKIDNDEGTDKRGQIQEVQPGRPMNQLTAPAIAVAQALLAGRVSYADDLLRQRIEQVSGECQYMHLWLPYGTIYQQTDCNFQPKGNCEICDNRKLQKIIPLGRYLSASAREKIKEGIQEYQVALDTIIDNVSVKEK
ncbi:MAG: hypothetical protein MRY78_04525 [Saprospiraceae bacterium]|nr:hypothetical protein [Saprospiraceae bacterium]